MSRQEKDNLLQAMMRQNPDTKIWQYLEAVREIEAILKSFEQYPTAFCWRNN